MNIFKLINWYLKLCYLLVLRQLNEVDNHIIYAFLREYRLEYKFPQLLVLTDRDRRIGEVMLVRQLQ
jgi:hypothetical protein